MTAFKGYVSTSLELNTTSAAYLFLGQLAQTGPSALPSIPVVSTYTAETSTSFGAATGISEEWESNVWRADPATKEIQLWWTNPDETAVQVQIIYIASDALFAATGNYTLFGEAYSRTVDPVVRITLRPFGWQRGRYWLIYRLCRNSIWLRFAIVCGFRVGLVLCGRSRTCAPFSWGSTSLPVTRGLYVNDFRVYECPYEVNERFDLHMITTLPSWTPVHETSQ